MTRELIGFLAIALVGAFALAAFLTVRSRSRRQETYLPKPNPALEVSGVKAFYVSTVFQDRPLDRVWAHGLGIRGQAQLAVLEGGLNITRKGEAGYFLRTNQLKGLSHATATIDKGVEKDGLVVIEWALGDKTLLTHVRFADWSLRTEFEKDFNQLLGARSE